MENKDLDQKEKESLEEWKMIKKHKPFYFEGNNISYSNDLAKRGKTRVLILNILFVWMLIACFVSSFCLAWFGYQDPVKNKPLLITFYCFIGVDVVVLTFALLNFIFNHVYTKQYKDINVTIYCNWCTKVLEINHIQKDYGSYRKVMIHEVNGYIVTIKGKNIEIKEKELGNT